MEPNYLAKSKWKWQRQSQASRQRQSPKPTPKQVRMLQKPVKQRQNIRNQCQSVRDSGSEVSYGGRGIRKQRKVSETSASQSAATATSEAASASQSASTATDKANIATQKATEIIGKAESAADSATKAQSYAVGGTGSREGEDSDNAKYYLNR